MRSLGCLLTLLSTVLAHQVNQFPGQDVNKPPEIHHQQPPRQQVHQEQPPPAQQAHQQQPPPDQQAHQQQQQQPAQAQQVHQQQPPPAEQVHQQQPPQDQQVHQQQPPPDQQMHQQPAPAQQVPPASNQFGGEQAKDEHHIKEHLDGKVDPTANMTPEQLQFHYFNMHDLDKNGKLDGVELIKAITHFHTENPGPRHQNPNQAPPLPTEVELESMIDAILKDDDFNSDGFIDYSEFSKAQKMREDQARAHQAQQQQQPPQQQQQQQQQQQPRH